MTDLLTLANSDTDDNLKARIKAAGWNKAKTIIVDGSSSNTQLFYAQNLLTGSPSDIIINGVLVVIQDQMNTDANIQSAVDTVVDKLSDIVGV